MTHNQHGKERQPPLDSWNDDDRDILRRYYSRASNLEIAELLAGRHTCTAVKNEAWRLGLKKSPERRRQVGQENVRWARARNAARRSRSWEGVK